MRLTSITVIRHLVRMVGLALKRPLVSPATVMLHLQAQLVVQVSPYSVEVHVVKDNYHYKK